MASVRPPVHLGPGPELEVSKRELAALRERQGFLLEEKRQRAKALVARCEHASVQETAAVIRILYRAGLRDMAEALARRPGVVTWDRAAPLFEIACSYRSDWQGAVAAVQVRRRSDVKGPIALCIPPGTYAAAPFVRSGSMGRGVSTEQLQDEDRYQPWPKANDGARRHEFAFLEAPVLVLEQGQDAATLEVPIACATFLCGVGINGQRLSLDRFAPASYADRLAIAVCAGCSGDECELQIALWIARADVTWPRFAEAWGAEGPLVTLRSYQLAGPLHATGAAKLLALAGLDAPAFRFFAHATWPD